MSWRCFALRAVSLPQGLKRDRFLSYTVPGLLPLQTSLLFPGSGFDTIVIWNESRFLDIQSHLSYHGLLDLKFCLFLGHFLYLALFHCSYRRSMILAWVMLTTCSVTTKLPFCILSELFTRNDRSTELTPRRAQLGRQSCYARESIRNRIWSTYFKQPAISYGLYSTSALAVLQICFDFSKLSFKFLVLRKLPNLGSILNLFLS